MPFSQGPAAESFENLVHASPDKGDHLNAGSLQHAFHGARQGAADEDLHAHFPDSGGPADRAFPFPGDTRPLLRISRPGFNQQEYIRCVENR